MDGEGDARGDVRVGAGALWALDSLENREFGAIWGSNFLEILSRISVQKSTLHTLAHFVSLSHGPVAGPLLSLVVCLCVRTTCVVCLCPDF